MSIQDELNQIKNAVYGSEVRTAIHDGMKKTYDDASANGNANMEVKMARGTFPVLNDRLGKLDDKNAETAAQLTHKVDKGNVSVNDINKNLGKLDQSYMTDEFISTFVENTQPINTTPLDNSITSEKLASQAVIPEKTSFIKQKTNLFNGRYYNIGLIGPNYSIIAEGDGRRSAIVKCKPNTLYSVSRVDEEGIIRLATFVDYPEKDDSSENRRATSDSTTLSITTGENDQYLVVNVSTDGTTPNKLQIQEGEFKNYEAPNTNLVVDLAKESIPLIEPDMTNFLIKNPENLWNGEYTNTAMVGAPVRVGTSSSGASSAILEVEPDENYTIELSEPTKRFRVTELSKFPETGDDYITHRQLDGSTTHVLTTTSDTTHIIVQVSLNDDDLPYSLVIVKGKESTKPYSLNSNLINNPKNTDSQKTVNYGELITDSVSGNYVKETDTFIVNPQTLDDAYNYWDSLMADAPEYITKELLFNEPVGNLPVYKYSFKPPYPLQDGGANSKFFKVLAISNIHGYEKLVQAHVIAFFTDLVKNWKDDDTLSMLRWNVQFDVIPVFNAYGYENSAEVGRQNGNGVDLNRNFPVKWRANDVESAYYSGTEPLSEYENQQLDLFLDNNSYDYAIDFHHTNPVSMSGFFVYLKTYNESVRRMNFGVLNQMNAYLHKEFPELVEGHNNNHFALIDGLSDGGRLYQFLEYKGIPSIIYETATDTVEVHKDVINQISVTAIGNILLNAVRQRDKYKLNDH